MRLQLLLHTTVMHSRGVASHKCCDRCAVLLQLDVPARIEAEKTMSLVPLNRDVKT